MSCNRSITTIANQSFSGYGALQRLQGFDLQQRDLFISMRVIGGHRRPLHLAAEACQSQGILVEYPYRRDPSDAPLLCCTRWSQIGGSCMHGQLPAMDSFHHFGLMNGSLIGPVNRFVRDTSRVRTDHAEGTSDHKNTQSPWPRPAAVAYNLRKTNISLTLDPFIRLPLRGS
ncbi:hypothetical protein VNO77_23443 [Canavalia gladiata]|uniref:Uncharacterized protein n=1 Tax=Canavalia gladiata TaxID=3824 RepID=A0AAN9L9N6_CANGL